MTKALSLAAALIVMAPIAIVALTQAARMFA
jgi:hypothetical protein